MNKHFAILLITSLFFAKPIIAQTDSLKAKDNSFSKNTIYFEVLGTGGLYSFNYDRIILSKNKFKGSFTSGVSYGGMPMRIVNINSPANERDLINGWSVVIPCRINFLYGRLHNLEAGLGPIFLLNTHTRNLYGSQIIFDLLTINYRYQKKNGGYFFKCGASIINKIVDYKYGWLFNTNTRYVTANLSFGYTFTHKKKTK